MNADALPRAAPEFMFGGVIRRDPEDFQVEEVPAFPPSGAGEHLLLRIEKRELNTYDVALELARLFEVDPIDVSFAGMKDRRAVTRQWFSVRTPRTCEAIAAPSPRWRVLGAARHARKLRRGELTGNAFRIRIRDAHGDLDGLGRRFERLARDGAPNYFGEQRFGRDGANVERARAWICRRPRPAVTPHQRGLHLSTARALLFNAVLAQRVAAHVWNRPIDGDVLVDGDPTGPLWGRGRPPSSGAARRIEAEALEPHREWLDPLEHLGLTQERRAFVMRPRHAELERDGTDVELRFELAAGQFATSLLRELGSLQVATAEPA